MLIAADRAEEAAERAIGFAKHRRAAAGWSHLLRRTRRLRAVVHEGLADPTGLTRPGMAYAVWSLQFVR